MFAKRWLSVVVAMMLGGCSHNGCAAGIGGSRAPALGNIEQLFAGYQQTCARVKSGEVYCAGSVRGAEEDPAPPLARPIPGLSNVASMMRGWTNCAVRTDGTVACWGANSSVVPARTHELHPHYRAIDVPGLRSIDLLAISDYRAPSWARVTGSGETLTWGGYPKDGTLSTDFVAPTAGAGVDLRDAAQAVFASRVCTRTREGSVRCWRPSPTMGSSQMEPERMPPDVPRDVVDIAIRDGTNEARKQAPEMCLLRASGYARCLRMSEVDQEASPTWTKSPFDSRQDWRDLDMFLAHQCGVTRDGRVFCSGFNGYGQLGRAEPIDSSELLEVPDVSDAIAVSVGDGHTCALLQDGTATCWGRNTTDECGHGAFSKTASPGEPLRHSTEPAPPSKGF